MIIDLKKIFVNDNSSMPLNCRFDLAQVDFMGEFPLKKPVEVVGKVYNRAGIVTLSVVCEYNFSSSCARCGVETSRTYKVPIERILVNELSNSENDEIILLQDSKLDLYELCYTEVVLSLPRKHLCKEDCKGICQVCGKNLNDGPCGCATKTVDPRLQALAQFLKD